MCLYQLSGQGAGTAWSSWYGDLVPATLRGRYFAGRNRIVHVGTCLAMIAGGLTLQALEPALAGQSGPQGGFGFALVFGVAAGCRLVSCVLLALAPELELESPPDTPVETYRTVVEAERSVSRFTARVKPLSVLGLLATVVLLFGFQGHVILDRPLLIALIAVPLIIQSYGIFAIAYAAAWAWRVPHNVAAPCALIGTSNFFELAVAVAIGLFGLNSGAALVTVVGVLVEVPVMLSLVAFANRTKHHFPASEEPLAESAAARFQHGDAR